MAHHEANGAQAAMKFRELCPLCDYYQCACTKQRDAVAAVLVVMERYR